MYCWNLECKGGGNNLNYQRETVAGQRFFSIFLFCKMRLNGSALIEI
jgi:hypothetical protein